MLRTSPKSQPEPKTTQSHRQLPLFLISSIGATTISIKGLFATFSIDAISKTILWHYAVSRFIYYYADCRYAEFCSAHLSSKLLFSKSPTKVQLHFFLVIICRSIYFFYQFSYNHALAKFNSCKESCLDAALYSTPL